MAEPSTWAILGPSIVVGAVAIAGHIFGFWTANRKIKADRLIQFADLRRGMLEQLLNDVQKIKLTTHIINSRIGKNAFPPVSWESIKDHIHNLCDEAWDTVGNINTSLILHFNVEEELNELSKSTSSYINAVIMNISEENTSNLYQVVSAAINNIENKIKAIAKKEFH